MCFTPVATNVLSQVLVSVTRFSLRGGVVGLTLNPPPLSGLGTSKSLRRELQAELPIVIGIDDIETVDSFTYLGSVMDADKGSTADISARLKKVRAAYYKLRKVWASSQYRRKTKLRNYKSNVMSVLLYKAECWEVNQNDGQRLNTFHNRCLRRILRIFGPRTITNGKLYEEVEISSITDIIKAR